MLESKIYHLFEEGKVFYDRKMENLTLAKREGFFSLEESLNHLQPDYHITPQYDVIPN
jgi:hypothetical protein